MAFLLDAQTIRRPHSIKESNDTQVAVQRALSGAITRDYFGSNKRVWELEFTNTTKTDYDSIKAIYDAHLSTGSTKTWEITETNYTIASTNVHIDLSERGFSVRGQDYLSDFTLKLTEA